MELEAHSSREIQARSSRTRDSRFIEGLKIHASTDARMHIHQGSIAVKNYSNRCGGT